MPSGILAFEAWGVYPWVFRFTLQGIAFANEGAEPAMHPQLSADYSGALGFLSPRA